MDLDLELVASPAPTLAVVDGMTEALALNGLDLRDNTDVARFLTLLPRRLARSGAAVLLVDHVVKDREARGRFAIGAQHKLAGIDVSYTLTSVDPFGRGRSGLSTLTVGKDRPGRVREHQALGSHIAELRLSSDAESGSVVVELAPPAGEGGGEFRPTRLMERVSRAVEEEPGLNKRAIRGLQGKNETLDLALSLLMADGFVRLELAGRAQAHFSVRPFRESDDD